MTVCSFTCCGRNPQFANGPSGQGVDDLFTPDVQAYVNPDDWNATDEAILFDKTHGDAVVNWINGRTALGTKPLRGDARGFVVGANFQAVSVAQKLWQPDWNFTQGGYVDAFFTPSAILAKAFQSVDGHIGRMIDALKANGLWNSTLVVLTAKHGQSPANKSANQNVGNPADIIQRFGPASWTNDDSLLIWYHDQSVANASCQYIKANAAAVHAAGPLAKVYCGPEVAALTGANPATDPKAPDIIVQPDPGVIYTDALGATKRAEHGGGAVDDEHVGLVVGGGVVPTPGKVIVPAYTKQIAPTILRALGLDPTALQGVLAEGTLPLPGLFCLETPPPGAAAAAACAAPPPRETCCTRVLGTRNTSLRVDFKQEAQLTSIRMWNVGPAGAPPLLQSPAQLQGFAVSIRSGDSATGCEVVPAGPAAAAAAPGFAAMGVACGGTGRWLEMSYPGLLAAPLQLGAVHVKVCVDLEVNAEQATPDAVLWVQNM